MKNLLVIISTLILCSLVYSQADNTIEIGTFNIRFFPCNQSGALLKRYNINISTPSNGLATDTIALFFMLQKLDIELLAVQEIVDPVLFRKMAKKHLGNNFDFIFAETNGWQKVGFLYDSSRIDLIGKPKIFPEISLGDVDRLRPAFSAYFKAKSNGFDFHAVVVHLKATSRGYKKRKQQWQILKEILEDLPERDDKDADLILLGDFNNVSELSYNEFIPTINNLRFFWTGMEKSISATNYWWNKKSEYQLESSKIDHIFISNDAKFEYVEGSTRIGGVCNNADQDNNTVLDYYERISDNCPVYSSFKAFPDND